MATDDDGRSVERVAHPRYAGVVYLLLPAVMAWVFAPLFAKTPIDYPYTVCYGTFWIMGLLRVVWRAGR